MSWVDKEMQSGWQQCPFDEWGEPPDIAVSNLYGDKKLSGRKTRGLKVPTRTEFILYENDHTRDLKVRARGKKERVHRQDLPNFGPAHKFYRRGERDGLNPDFGIIMDRARKSGPASRTYWGD